MQQERFQKSRADSGPDIQLVGMPDIVFMLLIFFMLVTVLRETEIEVRTELPQAEAIERIEERRLISKIHIGPVLRQTGEFEEGQMAVQIDDALIDDGERQIIRDIMFRKLQEEPRMIVSLEVDYTAPMRIVSEVQEELREANALRINYSTPPEDPGAAAPGGAELP